MRVDAQRAPITYVSRQLGRKDASILSAAHVPNQPFIGVNVSIGSIDLAARAGTILATARQISSDFAS